jgi:putative salt-induced outer membrane protein YdiY
VRQITDEHDNHAFTFITLDNIMYKVPNNMKVLLNNGNSKLASDITVNDDISESFISSVLRKYKYQ